MKKQLVVCGGGRGLRIQLKKMIDLGLDRKYKIFHSG